MIEEFSEQVYLLHDLLTPKECNALIEKTESIGFEEATIISDGVAVSAPEIRNNDRVTFDSAELTSQWWLRFEKLMPEYSQQWNAVSLNERLRFYRYKKDQIFRFHRDTPFERNNQKSKLSFIIYLNVEFEGGETDFREFKVSPFEGAALVFPHHLLHEGSPVTSGVKYAVRTDIMCGTCV